MTNSKNILTTPIVLLVAGVVLVGFIYLINVSPTLQDDTAPLEMVTVRHQYDEGEHRYSGSVNVPTPCHSLMSQAIVHLESEPDEVMLNLTTPAGTKECEQIVTSKMFLIAFKAEASALVAASLNGKNILFDTIEIEEGESVVLIQ